MGCLKTMSSPKTVKLTFEGTVPSKKNSRVNLRSGVSIPNKKFVQWQEKAMWEVRQQTRERFLGMVQVDTIIYFGTKGRADADNKRTSLLDMLVEMVVLPDDAYQYVAAGRTIGVYRKGKPGAFVRIREVTPEQVEQEIASIINE